ncbi:MAG: Clp protease N-terminal domain-containing protein [Candidatus Daviesbacteria bacterium]|nr:Clp protease N-terminal domain-containing protein [Candidatus Daviesbacteria bacterium]
MEQPRPENLFDQYKLSQGSKEAFLLATDEAKLINHAFVNPEHLMLGLIRQQEQPTLEGFLKNHGIDANRLREVIRFVLKPGDKWVVDDVRVTPSTLAVLNRAEELSPDDISPAELLKGIFETPLKLSQPITLHLFEDDQKLVKFVEDLNSFYRDLKSLNPPSLF